jgi:two-component system, NtrC family, sensor kinase
MTDGRGIIVNDSGGLKHSAYGRQRMRIVAVALLAAVVLVMVLGGAIYYQYSKAYETILIDQIKTLAASQSQVAEVFLRERLSLLSVLAETHTFEQLRGQGVLPHLFTAMNLRGDMLGLVDLGIINEEGDQVAYVGPFDLQNRNYLEQPWFNEVMTGGKHISDVYMGFRRQPHFIIAVRGVSGDRTWALRATIDSEVFHQLVLAVESERLGDAFIINSEGIYQTMPKSQGRILGQSDISPDRFDHGTVKVEKRVIDGVVHYDAGAWLRNKNWLLIIRRPLA